MNTGTAKKKDTPTPAQLKVLAAVHLHITKTKICPSFEEISHAVDINQSAVSQTLTRLKRDGFLVTIAGTRYRNLTLTSSGKKAARAYLRENEQDLPEVASPASSLGSYPA